MKTNDDSLNYLPKGVSTILKSSIHDLTTDTSMLGWTQGTFGRNNTSEKGQSVAFKINGLKSCKAPPIKSNAANINPRLATAQPCSVKKAAKRQGNGEHRRFPNLKAVFAGMVESDQQRMWSSTAKSSSSIAELRLQAIHTALTLKARMKVSDDTMLLSLFLFDKYLAASPDAKKSWRRCAESEKSAEGLGRLACYTLMMASKYSEVVPLHFQDLHLQEKESVDEYIAVEADMLGLTNYRVMPLSYISYIHVINFKVLRCPYWAQKMKSLVYLTILTEEVGGEEPVYLVFGIAFMLITKEIHMSLEEFKKCCCEFSISEKRCAAIGTALWKSLHKFFKRASTSRLHELIKLSEEGKELFLYS